MNPTSWNPNVPSRQQVEEVHLFDYLNVILRRRKVFSVTFLAVFLCVALYTFLATPIFEANATLHVKDENKAKGGILGELSLLASTNAIDAEIELLRSRTNVEKVVKSLHLDWKVKMMANDAGCQILEFTSSAANPEYLLKITGAGTYKLLEKEDGKLVGTGRAGELFRGNGVSLLVNSLKGKPDDMCELAILPFNETVEKLQKKLKVAEVGKKTNIIRVVYRNKNPYLAQELVNTLVKVYLDQNVAFKTEEAARTVGFVEMQLEDLRKELDKAEADLQGYKSSSGVVELDSEATELIGKLSETEKGRAAVTLQKKQVEFALASLNDAARKGTVYYPTVLRDDPVLTGLANRLADLEVQKRALLADYTKDHPAVKALQAQVDEVLQKIRVTYESALKDLTKQEGDYTGRLAAYEANLKRLPVAERDLARFTRLVKVNADIYTFLLQKHEEARIAQASTISNINVVDPAIVPDKPVTPQKARNIILGFVVGIMLGIGLAFFQDYLDDTIRNEQEAKRLLGFPLLGVIPFLKPVVDEKTSTIISHAQPKSVAAEAFRSLRTSIHFSSSAKEKKVLLVTSTLPGEGKSTISTNLSVIKGQTGARVIIIDGDLRRPSLHNRFGYPKEPGLSEILIGDADVSSLVHNTGIPGVDFISSGTTPPNPSELLGSEKMREFLESLRAVYDFVIVDAPPVLAVTDAPMLTNMVDIVALVVELGRVPVKAAQRTVEVLRDVQAPIAGLIVNDKSARSETYGYYGGRYYGYRYGYGGYGYYGEEDRAAKMKQSFWKRFFKR